MPKPTIREHMTEGPITVERGKSVAAALKVMVDRGVRHLPVVDGGKLLGVVSERDLKIIENMESLDSAHVLVGDALTVEPYSVAPEVTVSEVVREMARRRVGSAVIVEDGKVVGVFTTIDALGALADLLDAQV